MATTISEEIALKEINKLKGMLNATDYQAIKYAEGAMTAEEYAPIKTIRQSYRDKINELESIYGLSTGGV